MANGEVIIDVGLNDKKAIKDIDKLGVNFKKMGLAASAAVGAVGTAIGTLGIQSLKVANQMNDSMLKFQGSLGLTAEEAKNVANVSSAIWQRGFGESIEEVNDAVIRVRQNIGELDGYELEEVTQKAISLGKQFDGDVNEVTRAAGNLMKNFGIDSEKAFDLMAQGAQNGLNFSDELFDNLAEYSPLWNDMGYSAEEMFGILNKGAENGVYNLDYLNDVMKEFQIRATDGSKSTVEAVAELGPAAENVWKEFSKGNATVADLATVAVPELSKIKDQVKQNELGVALFGTKWEDLGGDVVLSMLESGSAVQGFEGTMEKLTQTQEQTFGQRWESLLRTSQAALEPLGNLLLSVGEKIIPTVIDAVNVFGDVIGALTNYIESDAVKTLTGYGENYKTLAKTISNIMEPITKYVMETLKKISAFWSENGQQVSEAVRNAWSGIKAIFEFFLPAIEFVVKVAFEAIKSIIDGALNLIMGSIKIFSGLFTGDFSKMWEGIKQVFSGAIDLIMGLLTFSFFGAIRTLFVNLGKTLIQIITKNWQSIVNVSKNFVTNFVSELIKMAAKSKSAITNLSNVMINAIKTLPTRFVQIGKDIVNGLINGVKEMSKKAFNAVKDMAEGLISTATNILQIHSPSRVFKEIGLWTGEGLEIGLNDSSKNVNNAMLGILDGIMDVSKSYQKEYQQYLKDSGNKNAKAQDAALKKIASIENAAAKKKRSLTSSELKEIEKLRVQANSTQVSNKAAHDKKYKAMVEAAEKDYLEVVKRYIEDKKSLDELTLLEESRIWEQTIEMFVVGSAQRVAVQKEYQKSLEAINKQINDVNSEYQKQALDLDKSYLEQTKALNKEYEDAWNSRYKSLSNFASTFEGFSLEFGVQSETLIENLREQEWALRNWDEYLDKVSAKGLNESIINELKELGPKALPNLVALNQMTDEQLTEYNNLYEEKHRRITKQVDEELSVMKKNTEAQLRAVKTVHEGELKALQDSWDASIKGLVTKTANNLSSLNEVGRNAGKNLLDGLKQMESPLNEQAKRMAESIKSTLEKSLNIDTKATGKTTQSITNPLKNAKIGLGTLATPSQSTINNIVNNSNSEQNLPNINPAPVVLNGKKIGEVAFEYVNKKQQSAYTINSIAKGVT